MSVKITSRVWEHSKQKGSYLLCMLALADNADDDGVCWPGQSTTATKIRMSIRNTRRLLNELEETGELFREAAVGRGNKSLNLVATAMTYDQLVDVLMRRFGVNKKESGLVALSVLSKQQKSGQVVRADKFAQKRTPRDLKADKSTQKLQGTVKNRNKNRQDSFAAKAATGKPAFSKKADKPSEKSGNTPPKVPAKGSPAWRPADTAHYENQNANQLGETELTPAFVLSVTAQKVKVLLYNTRDQVFEEKSVSPSKLSSRADPSQLLDDKGWELLGQRFIQPHVALIEAYHYSHPEEIRPIGEPNYSRNARVAMEMVAEAITVYDVVRYMTLSYPSYTTWARENKKPAVMTLEHVKTYIKDFLVGSKTHHGQKDQPAAGRQGANALGTGVLASVTGEASDLSPEHRQLLADNQRRRFGV